MGVSAYQRQRRLLEGTFWTRVATWHLGSWLGALSDVKILEAESAEDPETLDQERFSNYPGVQA